jgi:hypothetical protein
MADVEKNPDIIHAPGIYLGMDEQEYHADCALGSTDIRKLAQSPWTWQRDRLRPTTERVTDHMKWGAALHAYVLEGVDRFEQLYAIKPKPDDFDGALVTVEDLKAWLGERDQPVKSLRKAQLIEAVEQFLDRPVIFDRVLEEFWNTPRVEPEYAITQQQYVEIQDTVWMMQRHSVLSAIMNAGSLTGGAAEVSIFYEHKGWRRKARFDYALPPVGDRSYSMLCDLKSFANFRGADTEASALDTIYRMGYDLQAVDYLNGFKAARSLVSQGCVYGEQPFPGYVDSLFGSDEVWWVWLMIQKDAGFTPTVCFFDPDGDWYERDLHFQGVHRSLETAIENLSRYSDEFGFDGLWTAPETAPLRITASTLNTYFDRGY